MKLLSRRHFIRSLVFGSLWGMGFSLFAISPNRRPMIEDKKNELPEYTSSYLNLHKTGELKKRGEELWKALRNCKLCPRKSAVNRFVAHKGTCEASADLEISSAFPHYGEEDSLVGTGGSGAIFFTHCSLRCVYCINWEISIGGEGKKYNIKDLADMMLKLQERGCHNINIVTPTHFLPHLLLALDQAAARGLHIPLVYNTSGYEDVENLRYLDGVVDIYLPDFKYWDGEMAAKYSSGAKRYPEYAREAMLEMHRQVGVAKPAKDGVMYRGLMIRHLVLPHNISGTDQIVQWIANNLPADTYVHLMSQYRPSYKANEYPELSRNLYQREYRQAIRWAREAGLTNLEIQ